MTTPIVVTTDADVVDSGDGLMSLREALTLANGNSDADTISFDTSLAGHTLTLTGGELEIASDVTINGDVNGDYKADITISGNDVSRIFFVDGSDTDAKLSSLTLTNGHSSGQGGAVRVESVSSFTMVDSTIKSSYAGLYGGGLFAYGSTVNLGNVALLNNGAHGNGGGAYFRGHDTVTMQNATIAGNFSLAYGGGIGLSTSSSLLMYQSTVTRNLAAAGGASTTAGGGIYRDGSSTVGITNSVVAANYSGAAIAPGVYQASDVSGTVNMASHSVFGTAPTITNNFSSQTNAGTSVLDNSFDSSGRVAIVVPLGGLLIDAVDPDSRPQDLMDLDHDGNTAELLSVDARGAERVFGSKVDIGAVETFTTTPTDLYSALDTLPLRDGNGDVITADSLFNVDRETVVFVIRQTTTSGGALSQTAKAEIAAANNLVAAAQVAGHPLDVRIVTLDGTASLAGLSGSVKVLHLDRGDPSAMLAAQTLLDSFTAATSADTVPEYQALYRAPGATTISVLNALDPLVMGGHGDIYTLDGPLEAALAASGKHVNIATSKIFEGPTTTTRGQFDAVGEVMPNIAFRDQDGNALNLRSYGSDLVVVSFCTQWCAPCNDYSSHLEATKPMAGADYKFLEVMLEDGNGNMASDATAHQWYVGHHLTSPVVTVGSDPAKLMDLVRGANITGFPDYFVIDGKTGKIVDTWIGTVDLTQHLSDLDDRYYKTFAHKNFSGGSRSDKFTGGKGFDKIGGGGGHDTLNGLNGNDSISGGDGNDSIHGGTGRDTISGGTGSNKLFGDDGADSIIGGSGSETLDGGNGNDTLNGSSGSDHIFGQGGDDLVIGGAGSDTLDGGDGTDASQTLGYDGKGGDTLSYAGSKAVVVNLATNTVSGGDATGDVISNFENVIGSSHNDRITGDANNNLIIGGAGADTLDGGDGLDTLSYAGSTAVMVNLLTNTVSGGHATGDVISNFEYVIGSSGNDVLVGDNNTNIIDGGAGNDFISGEGAGDTNEVLIGGSGNDTLQGGLGVQFFMGGSGIDTVTYASASGAVTIDLGFHGYFNEAEGDLYDSVENIIGSDYDDVLRGNSGANAISGGEGKDTIIGSGGTHDLADYSYASSQVSITLVSGGATVNISVTDIDTLTGIQDLRGGSAGDIFVGDDADNRLSGNGGQDTLTGGAGKDHFVFDSAVSASSSDTVTDFVHGQDKIDLSRSFMSALSKAGALPSTAFYAAAGARHGHDSSDRIVYDKTSGKLYYDSDGSGSHAAVLLATLDGHPTVTAGDFVII